MPKRLGLCSAGLCGALLALSTSALAQSKASPAQPGSTLWDHNGSVMYLLAQGAAREFHYKELRAPTAEAGARPGALLFRGTVANGQFAGTAFIFDPHCGPLPYPVSGPIVDHDERVVLIGEAPLVGAKCRVQGHFTEVLEFRLQNANRTARSMAPENTPAPPLQAEEPLAPPAPAPAAPSREPQSQSPPQPSAAVVALAVNPTPAAMVVATPAPPPTQNAPVAVADAVPAPKAVAAAAPPAPQPAPLALQHPPALVADAAPAARAVAVSPPRPALPAPDLTAEVERTRAQRAQAAAAAEAVPAAQLAARRASAEAEAERAAAEANMRQSRDELRAAREEKFGGHSRQYLILAAMSWTLLLSGAAIVLLFVRLRRSQSSPKTEGAKTEDAFGAAMVDPFYSRLSGIVPRIDATAAAKSHGYQSGGRVRVFFQTRASPQSVAGSTLRRMGYAPR
jgi:hypothetical protein